MQVCIHVVEAFFSFLSFRHVKSRGGQPVFDSSICCAAHSAVVSKYSPLIFVSWVSSSRDQDKAAQTPYGANMVPWLVVFYLFACLLLKGLRREGRSREGFLFPKGVGKDRTCPLKRRERAKLTRTRSVMKVGR
jgi:hypothetical protein